MRGIKIADLPERYKKQVKAQLDASPARSAVAKQEQGQRTPLGGKSSTTGGMVHSDRPLLVRIIRVGGKTLDTDNLSGGCKEIRDAIAAAFGRQGDSERDGFTWEYSQENGH